MDADILRGEFADVKAFSVNEKHVVCKTYEDAVFIIGKKAFVLLYEQMLRIGQNNAAGTGYGLGRQNGIQSHKKSPHALYAQG